MKPIYWEEFPEIIAFTSTREMGNMGYQVGDSDLEVRKNRKRLYPLLTIINKERLVLTHQSHSDIILEVTSEHLGRGTNSFEEGMEGDALYTKERNIALGVFHADCVPIFFYCKNKKIVGIIHAGYKGTLKHIAFKAINYIIEKEGVSSDEIYVHIGPARHVESFVISEDKTKEIIDAKCVESIKVIEGKEHFDAVHANTKDLIAAGVPITHISTSPLDTAYDDNLFSAYKKTPLGRMVSVIKLK